MQVLSFLLLLCVMAINPAYAQSGSPKTLSKPLSEVALYPSRSASATALSINDTTISAQLLASISQVKVNVSQRVSKGELLVVLDCADYRLNREMATARLEAAEAQLVLADSQLTRSKQLFSKSLTSQEQVDTRSAERVAQNAMLKQREVELKQQKLNVSRCSLKAPFDGVVTGRLVSEGQLANIGTPLLSLVETGNIELSANVSYDDAEYFSRVKDFVFDYREKVPVAISQIGGVIDPNTRNQEVRFRFPSKSPLPGTAGKLMWNDPRSYIPPRLIVKRNGQLGVFLDDDGVARFTPLPSASPGRPAVTDMSLNTMLVVAGITLLQDGDQIKVQ